VGADLWQAGIPASVRDVITWRAARLGHDAVWVLSVAAVIGPRFDLDILATASERGENDVLDIVEMAIGAKLVVNEEADTFCFSHALVGHALHDGLAPARRMRIHRRIAEALERLRSPADISRITDLAFHFNAACSARPAPDELDKALRYTCDAGDTALNSLAPEDALAWYRQALQLLDRMPHAAPALRCKLMIGIGDAERQSGDPASTRTLLAAAELARDLGDTDALVAAVLANSRGIFSTTGLVDESRITMINAALDAVGPADSAPRARLLGQLAVESLTSIGYVERTALVADAAGIARRLGDPSTLLDVLVRPLEAVRIPDTLADRLATTAEAERLARSLGDRVELFWSLSHRTFAAVESANPAEAERCHHEASDLAAQLGQPTLRWLNGLNATWFTLLHGDAHGAERFADQTRQWGMSSGQPDALVLYRFQLHIIRWHQGRGTEVIGLLQWLTETIPLPLFAAALARVYVDVGRHADAGALLTPVAADGFAHLQDLSYLAWLSNWAEVAVQLRHEAAIDTLRQRLLPYDTQVICSRTHVAGAVAHYLGILELANGDHERARHHLTNALAIHQAFNAPFHTARTHLALAEAHLADRHPESHDHVVAHARAAREIAAAAGCTLVRATSDRFLHDLTRSPNNV
jgi:tetratricopeptide (TPR) repeat protein